MQAEFERALTLQASWTRHNVPEMAERGVLVRHGIPNAIRDHAGELSAALGPFGEEFCVEGSDGTGLKAQVPWVRLYSEPLAPSATEGWYCVFLFRPDGRGMYLCLSHGSTSWDGGSMTVKSRPEALRIKTWAQELLAERVFSDERIKPGLDLGKRVKLASAYENTTAYSIYYETGSVPSDDDLIADIKIFLRFLEEIYNSVISGSVPGEPSPDVVALNAIAGEIANPLRPARGGQGFGLDATERRAVEMRAMSLAKGWLRKEGYKVKDVHKTMPYDFTATRGGVKIIVEVKGTTGIPTSFFLTKNELAAHRKHYPDNALIVVHGVKLDRKAKIASGGTLLVLLPWELNEKKLTALSYQYSLD